MLIPKSKSINIYINKFINIYPGQLLMGLPVGGLCSDVKQYASIGFDLFSQECIRRIFYGLRFWAGGADGLLHAIYCRKAFWRPLGCLHSI